MKEKTSERFLVRTQSELPIESSSDAVGAMIVMPDIALHVKVHGLFIPGLDAVAKADNAPGSFLVICFGITVGCHMQLLHHLHREIRGGGRP